MGVSLVRESGFPLTGREVIGFLLFALGHRSEGEMVERFRREGFIMRKRIAFFSGIILFLTLLSGTAFSEAVQPFGELSIDTAKNMLSQTENPEEVVGIYDLLKADYHGRFLVIPNRTFLVPEAQYVGLVIESSNKKELSGAIKFFLKKTDADNIFDIEYYEYGLSTLRFVRKGASSGGLLLIYVTEINTYPPNIFVKTKFQEK